MQNLQGKKLVIYYCDRYESIDKAELVPQETKLPKTKKVTNSNIVYELLEFNNLEKKETKNSIIVSLDILETLDIVDKANDLLSKNKYEQFVQLLNDEIVGE